MTTSHRCIAGPDCCRAQYIDRRRAGALTEKRDTLCDSCRRRIENAARELPKDWADLRKALGEHASAAGQRIRSTPTPAIPISTRREALMRAIVDMADRAAALVSDALNTDQPTGKRKITPVNVEDREIEQRAWLGAAWKSDALRRPSDEQLLAAAIKIVQPNIDALAAAPSEAALVWSRPRRCAEHTRLIQVIEECVAAEPRSRERAAAENQLRRAYEAAGECEECNGWGQHGQERELTELSGIQLALELVELHNQTRAELGLTRLRHEYTMPCPDCGSRVYRNDGESIVICEGNAKHTCTEREYKVRAGLLLEQEAYTLMAEYLLAESYWRLDRIQTFIDTMTGDPDIDLPGAGTLILDKLRSILTDGAHLDGTPIGHQPPDKRAAGTDRKAALQRQVDEDNWTWRNEPRYQPPKRKPRKAARRPTGPAIATSSLLTVIDTDETAALAGQLKCTEPGCNMVHAGECP